MFWTELAAAVSYCPKMQGKKDAHVHANPIIPGVLNSPKSLENLEGQLRGRIQAECPNVDGIYNYAVLGGCDYLDIFPAPDTETAMKVSTIVRNYWHAQTETWSASEWRNYKELIRNLPSAEIAE